ncbi:MAG: beta-ketoacyl-ACP synthase II [Planctomycetia bacterium]|nr:beta-ketoacyl-ACP synthase II [Planctomycetia bacterium]
MSQENIKRRVVITGMGLATPLGYNVETVWTRICNGESGVIALTDGVHSLFRSKIAGLCSDFSTEKYLLAKDAKKMERFTQLAYTSAIDAVEHSGLDFSKEDLYRCGVIIGCGVGGLDEIETQQDRLRQHGASRISPFTIPKIMLNAAGSHISIHYGIHGPVYGIATACASANNAMIDSFKLIRDNEVDLVITGGTEAAVSELGIAGFVAMRALSERNDEPAKASRPFDKDRDGFVIAEGAGILIFEELEHAKKRRAKIYAEVLGYGMTTDACHITQPDKEGIAAGYAMAATLRSASLRPDQVDYINAHGTSTILGDLAEVAAIKRVFGNMAYSVAISSTKSEIGHLLGGSGGVELIFSILAMRDHVVPPTINLENPDPECDLDFTPLVAKEKRINSVISNSFGFGGHNACIAIGRFDE